MFNRIKTEKQINQKKIVDTQYMIYDWQFKRFKNRVERERYRIEYDNLKNKLEALNELIKQQAITPTMSKDDVARLPDEKERMEKEIKKNADSMKQCDDELNGVLPTVEHPEGSPGIETMIEAFRDLQETYKAYIKIL